MCGIAGWLLTQRDAADPARLEDLGVALAHRGPDDRGHYVDAAAGLAFVHNRLSIIDLTSAGHQPMIAEDAGVVISFNGELYNFRSLRDELQSKGHVFRSRTDSEVVLRSFVEWGPACFEKFCGMFAAAIWNGRERRLYLARDPTGMKPLYYWESAAGLVFASEIKAFLALPDFKPRMDTATLKQFVEFGYCYDEDRTSLAGVRKLPPGTFMCVQEGRIVERRGYYIPPSIEERVPGGVTAEESLHAVLSEVVRQHLVADVPVGLLLSGGLDSSLIAALAAKHQPVRTITMAFGDSRIDERGHAQVVAGFIGSSHSEVVIQPREIVQDLAADVRTFDDLFADWGTLSTRLLYRRCREAGVKVVLVGEGADELFGGYPIFDKAVQLKGPRALRLFQLHRMYASRRYGAGYFTFARVMSDYLEQTDGDWFSAVRLFESRRQLPNNYVMKVDKASMSVSVEARAPYLDRRVADAAYRAPAKALLEGGTNKALLRKVAKRYGLLPPEIYERPKFGASMAASWMEEVPVVRNYAREVVLDPSGWARELGLQRAMADYFDGKAGYPPPHALGIFAHLAWRLLLLNLWSRHYLMAAP